MRPGITSTSVSSWNTAPYDESGLVLYWWRWMLFGSMISLILAMGIGAGSGVCGAGSVVTFDASLSYASGWPQHHHAKNSGSRK